CLPDTSRPDGFNDQSYIFSGELGRLVALVNKSMRGDAAPGEEGLDAILQKLAPTPLSYGRGVLADGQKNWRQTDAYRDELAALPLAAAPETEMQANEPEPDDEADDDRPA